LPGSDEYVDSRVPAHVRDEVGIEAEVHGTVVTIVECRPPWRADIGPKWTRSPVARLKYSPTHAAWTLFWRDRDLWWHRYERIGTAAHVAPLLAEIEADPTAISGVDGRQAADTTCVRPCRGQSSPEPPTAPSPFTTRNLIGDLMSRPRKHQVAQSAV
jgi:hypothetical protein